MYATSFIVMRLLLPSKSFYPPVRQIALFLTSHRPEGLCTSPSQLAARRSLPTRVQVAGQDAAAVNARAVRHKELGHLRAVQCTRAEHREDREELIAPAAMRAARGDTSEDRRADPHAGAAQGDRRCERQAVGSAQDARRECLGKPQTARVARAAQRDGSGDLPATREDCGEPRAVRGADSGLQGTPRAAHGEVHEVPDMLVGCPERHFAMCRDQIERLSCTEMRVRRRLHVVGKMGTDFSARAALVL